MTFPIKYTLYYKEIADNSCHPAKLLQQVVGVIDNKLFFKGENFKNYTLDPVGDRMSRKTKGIIHKYHGRVLWLVTKQCAGHCRYCFRQHFDYEKANSYEEDINYIRNNKSIREVILSGGDPLTLDDEKITSICKLLNNINHVQILRIHTRILTFAPYRINKQFCEALNFYTREKIFVTHFNHVDEITPKVDQALQIIRNKVKIVFLNQSVLLRGINDTLEEQMDIAYKLNQVGIIPYYLNQLDMVKGAESFEVDIEKGKKIIKSMQMKMPGYLVPRYVKEVAGENYKIRII